MPEQTSPLRQRMIDDMTIRNMSVNTQKAYTYAVPNFSAFHGRSPDKLGRRGVSRLNRRDLGDDLCRFRLLIDRSFRNLRQRRIGLFFFVER
jgi:hypothetical protein